MTPDVASFFDLCPTVMLLFEIDGFRIVVANAAAVEKYGYTREELTTMTILDLRPPEDVPRITRFASRLMDGTDTSGRSRHITKNGDVFCTEVHTRVVELEGRLCKLASVYDVTQQVELEGATRKRLAQAAAHAHATDAKARHFAQLFNLAPGCLVVLAPEDFEVVAITEDYLALTGQTRMQVIGHPYFRPAQEDGQTSEPDKSEALLASLRHVVSSGHMKVMHVARLPFARSASARVDTRGWSVVLMPILAPDGTVAMVLLAATEAGDERARYEAATADSPQLFGEKIQSHEVAHLSQRLAEYEALTRINERLLHVHIWRLDVESWRLEWSDALFDLLGLQIATQAPTFNEYIEMVHPDDRNAMIASYCADLDSAQTEFTFDHRIIRPDGQIVHLVGAAERITVGGRTFFSGVVQDVTRERKIEANLRRSQKLAALGQLAGGIAHDFNNLLTVVLGNTEQLLENLDDHDDLRAMAALAVRAAERGAALTNRLLAFARQQPLEPVASDMNARIVSMAPLLRHSLGENVDLQLVLTDDLWFAEIDTAQFEAALLNLALNARDAMPSGGTLSIKTANAYMDAKSAALVDTEEGDFVVISVTDTGNGMMPEITERVLEPFFTTKEDGSGLGLPMVYGFLCQSGGALNIYSDLGEGTTVEMYLPRSWGKMDTAHVPPEQSEATLPVGQEHILVVENDAFVRQHVVILVRSLGYRHSEAENAETALEVLRDTDDIDLLFTDIIMPGKMNGRELAAAALRFRPELRVLYTSGYAENAILQQSPLGLSAELLPKPYRRNELALKLRAVLDRTMAGP
ncbi:PAS domain S-box protein [Natronohydrobacter thiooxidans]|uniref:PAS domain S-box protein n=1 Tax=Natronohydrobacter thiooxidans TaxID=87172 RepID=UPI0008FF0916|nr:PAS domain S-box protein [Natronohydrobacter thiooxidans]